MLRAADLVDDLEAVLEWLRSVVEELRLVRGSGRAALGTRPVVRDHHHDRVVQLALFAQEVEQPAEMVVGVAEEAREHLHHPAEQPARLGWLRRPVRYVGVVPGQLRVGGHDAEFLLPGEDLLPIGVPALVESTRVLVGPLLRHMVWRVSGPEAEVQVERLARVDLLGVGDELDRPVDQILGEVVSLLRRARRLDLVVVVHEVGIPLTRVAPEEAVEALEPATERPAGVGPRRCLLIARGQVPLADHERAVALLHQHLRQHPVLERDDPVVAGEAGRQFGDRGHAVAVMVPPGDDAGPARRTQRRGVHVREPQPGGGQRVEVRCLDRTPVAAQVTETRVVQHHEHHVRAAGLRPGDGRPRRTRLIGCPSHHTGERSPGRILLDRHDSPTFARKRSTGRTLQPTMPAC